MQDLTIDSTVGRAQYQFILRGGQQRDPRPWVPKLLERLAQAPELANVSTNFIDSGLTVQIDIDRDTAARFGVTAATIDNALYDAFGQRIISTIYTQSNEYRVIMEGDPNLQNSVDSLNDIYVPSGPRQRRPGAAGLDRAHLRAIRAAGDRSPRAVPGGDVLVRRRPGGLAGKRGRRDPRRRAAISACRSASPPPSRARRWRSSPRCATRCC